MSLSADMEKKKSDPSEDLELWIADLGMAKVAASLIEAFGSLSSLFAQVLYISQPMLEAWLPAERLSSLAELLEDEEQSAAFAARLRGRRA